MRELEELGEVVDRSNANSFDVDDEVPEETLWLQTIDLHGVTVVQDGHLLFFIIIQIFFV